ncbi:NAD(P)H-binding protein [Streptomyces hainanensis]|uniref:NAD-dependent epimerase/dehydratase family protein n=1 Tax=Streptomyces hainanensis TaxID=402648 RepID=A0A4R4TSU0_9ACTN|nr:NAD(P)H-binding protein [Streptomyces hainanensis]TDC78492.1 NAD-dependent epimerase/dehydratase family protein [Streptomyces hainanensis]
MIVVTGATGNVGRALVRTLSAAGETVTAVSRGVSAADVPAGVLARPGDLTEAASLRPVLDGADALFLQSGGASAERLNAPELLDLARAAGIRRVVLLSSVGVATRPESPSHGGVLGRIEEAVRGAGLDWTVLRPGAIDSNALQWAASVRAERTVAAPFGDVGVPAVDPADIAEVAAVTLRQAGHEGLTYILTGPEPSSPRQQAAAIAAALGEPVRFHELTPDEARAGMLRFMPEAVVETTLAVLGTPNAGETAISQDVQRVTGRPARPFAAWAQRNQAAFR